SVCPAAPAGTISFCGHGWGHGVGLAQYGALGMAQQGRGWQQIVQSFYSGVSISAAPSPQTIRILLTGAGSTLTSQTPATLRDAGDNQLGTVAGGQAVSFHLSGSGVAASWAGGTATASP